MSGSGTSKETPLAPPKNVNPAGGPIIEASQGPEEYQRALQIILGTVCTVLGLLGVIGLFFLLYRFLKHRSLRYQRDGNQSMVLSVPRSLSIDAAHKQLPTVLVLYSYDCAIQERVVQAFAGMLMEGFHCNVHLDILEELIIMRKGLEEWLIDCLQEVDFIIVVCSLGARLQCSKKHVRFKHDPSRAIADYFPIAVDYVGEKMRVERIKGLPMSKFITAYFDFSTVRDIPTQLELGVRFCLPRDLDKLYCHIHGHGPESGDDKVDIESSVGISESSWFGSEVGAEMFAILEQARSFFKNNPNWVEDRIEHLPADRVLGFRKFKGQQKRRSSLEKPLLAHVSHDHIGSPPPKQNPNTIDTTVELHSLPPMLHHKPPQAPVLPPLLYSRKNSLPSSLSSHPATSTPQLNASKSFDSFQCQGKFANHDSQPCILCGQHGHPEGRLVCQKRAGGEGSDLEEDPDPQGTPKTKSKSMPTMFSSPGVRGSQTVFKAEVHQEWGGMGDGRVSPASSTGDSDSQLGSDSLERDLQSITSPTLYGQNLFPNLGSVPREFHAPRSLSSSALGVVPNGNLCLKPVPTLVPLQTLQPTKEEDSTLINLSSLESSLEMSTLF